MPLSTIEKRTHQRRFSEWLDSLRAPIVHGVLPNMEIALVGYAEAEAAFAPGGIFDTQTPSDYQAINAEFLDDFREISAALATAFVAPKRDMTITEIAEWMYTVLVQIDAANPGVFGYISAERKDK